MPSSNIESYHCSKNRKNMRALIVDRNRWHYHISKMEIISYHVIYVWIGKIIISWFCNHNNYLLSKFVFTFSYWFCYWYKYTISNIWNVLLFDFFLNGNIIFMYVYFIYNSKITKKSQNYFSFCLHLHLIFWEVLFHKIREVFWHIFFH